MRRWVGRGIAALALLGVIFAGATVIRLLLHGREAAPPASGSERIAALTGTVEVFRDPLGVPHVQASRMNDAYAGLGFVHAQDRLWQMEVLRRAARGTLSELFGKRALAEDRLARTLGFAHDAQQEPAILSRQSEQVLSAYAAGVNAWIERLRRGEAPLPLEFEWLELLPEPWTPADTLAIVRLRAWNTGRSLGASLLLDRLVRELGGVPARDFFPVRPEDGAHDPLGQMLELGKAADGLAESVGMNGPVGSLGFVVSGERAAGGGALLANDPHVQFGLPALFYLAHLRTGDQDLSGATWPGVPVFWTGTNRKIAWGQVALHVSVSDLFDETFHPTDPLRYDRNGRWRHATSRVETIKVRGEPDRKLEIVSTHHGPLLRSVDPEESRAQTLALSWAGHADHSGFDSMLRIANAHDWTGFRAALQDLPAPAATFLYADSGGNIGTQVAGHLPIRAIETGLLPVTGGSRYYDWRGFMDFEQLPSRYGADLPWLVASTHPDEQGFAAPVVWLWSNPAGAIRIDEMLATSRRIDLPRVLQVQRDRSSHRGRATIRHLLGTLEPNGRYAQRIRNLLLDWDGRTAEDSVGASVYHVFRQRLTARLLETQLTGADRHIEEITDTAGPLPGIVLARYLDRARDREIEGLVETSLDDTWRYMRTRVSSNPKKWEWGRVHRVRLLHDFERMGSGATWLLGTQLSRGPFAAPGGPDSVWTMYHRRLPTTTIEVGPVLRYAIDLADPDHAQVGLAGGQSGHPADPHYDDALSDWLGGRSRPLWMHWSDLAYHRAGEWELRPAGD